MSISGDLRQRHFTLYELVLPYCNVCTPLDDGTPKFNTPLTCQESSDSEYSLYFCDDSAPLNIDIKNVFRERLDDESVVFTPLQNSLGAGEYEYGYRSGSYGYLVPSVIYGANVSALYTYEDRNDSPSFYSTYLDFTSPPANPPEPLYMIVNDIKYELEKLSDTRYRYLGDVFSQLNMGQDYNITFSGNAPRSFQSRLNSSVFRYVTRQSEDTAKLKPAEGLAKRSKTTVTFNDFVGDPGPIEFTNQGTFFGKLLARNVLEGKKIIAHHYTYSDSNQNGVVAFSSVHYIEKAELNGTKFTITAKDTLKDIEEYSEQFPKPVECTLVDEISDSATSFTVNDGSLITDWLEGYTPSEIRIDDELMSIVSVVGNVVTVIRGDRADVFKTNVSAHDAGSNVQPCYTCDKLPLVTLLADIYRNASIPGIFLNTAQWQAELDEWNAGSLLTAVFSKPRKTADFLNTILTQFVIDMWFDQPTQKILLSAISSWKEEARTLSEDGDFEGIKYSIKNNNRFSRAYIIHNKPYQAETDDPIWYNKLTIFTDTASEHSDLQGDIKVKEFEPSDFLSDGDAFNACNKYVTRFSTPPQEATFTMEERKLVDPATGRVLTTGDIVKIQSRDRQDVSGNYTFNQRRAQITQLRPEFSDIGRKWKVSALTYVAQVDGGGNFAPITGNVLDLNLWEWALRPSKPINATFIIDGATVGSSERTVTAIRAGNFPAGSTIKIICIGGAKWSAKGGDGAGLHDTIFDGLNGANSYQADGIKTDIYLNYGTVDGYVTDCELYAAGGGGGSAYWGTYGIPFMGGGGGNGIPAGAAGLYIPGSVGTNIRPEAGTFNTSGRGGYHSSSGYQTIGGDGGNSVDGVDGSNIGSPPNAKTTLGGDVGKAFVGGASIVTVYNLAADASKLNDGGSVPGTDYTLVTA